jgi:hypothetical protein
MGAGRDVFMLSLISDQAESNLSLHRFLEHTKPDNVVVWQLGLMALR